MNFFGFPSFEQMMSKPPATKEDIPGYIDRTGVGGGTIKLFGNYLGKGMDQMYGLLGHMQRGKPEQAMREAQNLMGGGEFSHYLEHIGDLTHRFTTVNPGAYGKLHNAPGVAKTTWDSVTRNLKSNYQWNKENVKGFANKFPSFDDFESAVRDATFKYSAEHAKLPVFNSAQKLARDAAVDLGKWKFKAAGKKLNKLKEWQEKGILDEKIHYGTKMLKKKGLLD